MKLGRSKDFCMWLLLWFPRQQGEEPLDTVFLLLGGRCTGPALGNMIQATDVSLADACHLLYCGVHTASLTCRAQLMYRLQVCCPCVIRGRSLVFRGKESHHYMVLGILYFSFLSFQLWERCVCFILRNSANWDQMGPYGKTKEYFPFWM